MKDREMYGGLFWPALLIAAGIILLLNNTGQLDWTVWDLLFRLWPVLLIAWGLDLLIGRRSMVGAVVSLVLIAGVITGSVVLLNQMETERVPLAETIAEPIDDVSFAAFTLDPAIGNMRISSLADSSSLFEARIPSRAERWTDYSITTTSGVAAVQLGMRGSISFPGVWGANQDWNWDVSLSEKIPMDLDVNMGAGRVELDLTDLLLEEVQVDLGVGEAVVRMPQQGRVSVEVDSGIGQTTIIIPASMAARIHIDSGLSGHTIPVKYEHQDDVYTSPDYTGADDRIDLYVSQGIGQITIRHAGDH